MQYIQSSIRPYITYSFCLGIYSPADLKRMDSKLIALVKKAYGLGQAAPNNMVPQERDLMGLGLTSLMVDYVQRVGATLTRALNDNGPLGWSTWALLRHQHRQLAGMRVLTKDKTHPKLEAASKDFHILKKVSLLKDANIKITSPTPELQPYLDLHSNDMVELLRDAGYDPLGLGLRSEIPPRVYMPLLQLGICCMHGHPPRSQGPGGCAQGAPVYISVTRATTRLVSDSGARFHPGCICLCSNWVSQGSHKF